MKTMSLPVLMLAMVSFLTCSAPLHAANNPQLEKEGYRTLQATITKITGDTVYFKTEENTTRNFSVKILEKLEKVKNPQVGDQLVIQFDEGNSIAYIDRIEDYQARENHLHPTVSGLVRKFDSREGNVTLKLKDGTVRTYKLAPSASIKMSVVPEGALVLMEVDEKNGLVKDIERGKGTDDLPPNGERQGPERR